MKTHNKNILICILISLSLVVFVGVASAATCTVTPDLVVVGEFVTLEGAGFGATETVTLNCSITDLVIPVSECKYNYRSENFNLSDKNTSFSVSVQEVADDMKLYIKKSGSFAEINKSSPTKYGFEFDYDPITNTATISLPMPINPSHRGVYELIEVTGTAANCDVDVSMDVTVTNNVTTDATGYFKTVIDTHGIPIGDYGITADEVNVTLDIIPSTYTIALTTGWNLISVPLNLTPWALGDESVVGDPLNVTPKDSLTSIYRYNTTTGVFEKSDHVPGYGWWPATESESFTELEPSRGFWVWAKNDCDLTFTGTAHCDLDVALKENWNLIGWYSMEEALLGQESVVGDPLTVTPTNSLTSIYRYVTTTGTFEKSDHVPGYGWWPATGSWAFTNLEQGKGYWVWADNDCVWWHRI
ncbi:hypothetical protein C5S35_00010 [Candidatus Methanophagaceae archaeon]|nr:hypothetical protein C5S35_00010 [Methanophagales archaeon]